MEKLLSPDFGLMFWTVLTFSIVVFLLGKFVWPILLQSIEEREGRLRREKEESAQAREEAQKLKLELERQLNQIDQRAKEVIKKAFQEGERTREELLQKAQQESQAITEKYIKQLQEEKERLTRELRTEVADLSLQAAEKLIRAKIDKAIQERILTEFFGDLDHYSKKVH